MDLYKAKELIEEKMREHGLQDWTYKFDSARRRFGQCNYWRKRLSFSKPLILQNEEPVVLDTILHEIAHALTRSGHSARWRSVALNIGCNGKARYSHIFVKAVPHKWKAVCPQCSKDWHRHRKIEGGMCPFCHVYLVWHNQRELT